VRSGLVAVVVLIVGVSAACPGLYSIAGSERDLRVAWESHQDTRRGFITGHVFNDSGTTAYDVLLRIEGLDEAGRVVSTSTGYVTGTVPAFDRTYFEVAVPAASAYRVTISSYQLNKGGGGM